MSWAQMKLFLVSKIGTSLYSPLDKLSFLSRL